MGDGYRRQAGTPIPLTFRAIGSPTSQVYYTLAVGTGVGETPPVVVAAFEVGVALEAGFQDMAPPETTGVYGLEHVIGDVGR